MRKIFTILLVEDNPEDALLTRKALSNSKVLHTLQVVGDGFEALAYLHRTSPFADSPQPDLILLDLVLPLKDGWEVLAEIKADPDLHRIPVVILTSLQEDKQIAKAYDLHANGFIVKPVNYDEFAKTIQNTCEFWLSVVLLPTNIKKVDIGQVSPGEQGK
jgi:chemotaxis family two-component system response regulator Rcp1